ncbi:peptidoglycan-binding protein [Streptomyces sp. NBC_00208]|uniref:peptidoglycan-binding domain-containing protein n=1 Tax=Streptomyces sp. NBC_00208 TaxID=2975681 RepID=UPI002E2B99AE|nr:peptidoglycan-binding domain-containing protein [Streptomyces sp. NBC_00208]
MGRTKAFAARVAIVIAMLLGASLATATPASAATVTWGWGDNPMLCATSSSCVKTGNTVRMWQSLLYAEGLYSDVDGVFGPNTAAATVQWQRNHGLGNDADGWVGPNTWNKAHSWVTVADPSEQDSGTFYHFYRGTRLVLLLHQGITGVWEFKRDVDGGWYTATY